MPHSQELPAAPAFQEQWKRFLERYRSIDEKTLSELEVCWRDMRAILEGPSGTEPPARPLDPGELSLEGFQTNREEAARLLLHEPAAQWRRKRPYKRAWMALETYARSLEDLVTLLPETTPVSGSQALAVLKDLGPYGFMRRMARFRRKPRPLPLRSIINAQLQRRRLARSELEGEYFVTLAQAIREMRRSWEIVRAVVDGQVQGRPLADEEVSEQRRKAKETIDLLCQQGEEALRKLRSEPESAGRELAGAIISFTAWPRPTKPVSASEHHAAMITHRSREWRALEAEVQLELDLERCEIEILKLLRQSLEHLHQELGNLLLELDGVIDWLRRKMDESSEEEFPPPKADVVPFSSRLAEIEASINTLLHAVPARCETLPKFSITVPRRISTRSLKPRETCHEAFIRSGRSEIARVLEEIELEHRKIVQEIERARQVVAFGLESAGSGAESDRNILRESLQNAYSLLEFYRGERPDWRDRVDPQIARSTAAVFAEARLILSRDRLGVLTYLAQQGLRRGFLLASRSTAVAIGGFLLKGYHYLESVVLRFLVYIGWKAAPAAGKLEVITRPYLPAEFIVDINAKELPSLYRRLFRFDPVQDPRFLIGRERELAAISQARSFWAEGRPVGIIVVGQRGSGKTSLINCALKRSLSDLDLIRAEFEQRMTTEDDFRLFVSRLVGSDNPANLEEFLLERKRLIILEELERTFLRQVGHYGAIRGLQRLIAATCSSTLWILATNQVAFQFLNASMDLGQSFSHRIYAGTASRDDLRRAILLRHNLSGLRLSFEHSGRPGTLIQRVQRAVEKQRDAEAEFFDVLSSESAGVYRSAFDIWLAQIETAHSGVLHMKPLLVPDLTPVIDDLDMSDLFTLVAVLQHGSLTPEEHSKIFLSSPAMSRTQIDELLTREILEQDPGRPGFRIRPEAMRVVKEALYRRNLL